MLYVLPKCLGDDTKPNPRAKVRRFLLIVPCRDKKKAESPSFFMKVVFVYLCIFRAFFRAILKEPNLRFESAHLTSSKRLFEKLIKAL
ncbi:MAG: hypothetical protein EGR08_06130 [Prevotella sp.]|nr:hypothetical protein [Prevotella sp.]